MSTNYDFSTLSPEDFERFCADLFSAAWGFQLEIFKAGKDGGIDLRHSRSINQSDISIFQCKRYAPHKFTELKASMLKELPKLEKLKPSRYVLVTSVKLSSDNKKSIIEGMRPYIAGPQDIYGSDELNSLLTSHPSVLRSHFKLWISSTEVLESVLHSRIFNISETTVDSVKAEMSRLVMHEGFDRALSLLNERNHCVIAGNPGIGKTTLARMLMCHYLKDGFTPIVVTGDIADAWTTVSDPKKKKQKFIVLYDDFLGTFRFEEKKFGKNEDASLMSFIKRAEDSKGIKFILTTREYIMADAQKIHGTFEKDAKSLAKCTILIDDYAPSVRAEVLFNHLYFSDLDEDRLELFVAQKIYLEIISHSHFNPRVIEAISKQSNSRALTAEEYIEYIREKFDDPSDLWIYPFESQISYTARLILLTLWSLGGTAEIDQLKEAVSSCAENIPATVFSANFKGAMKELTGNFIAADRVSYGHGSNYALVISFQNPSVAEFIYRFVNNEPAWPEELARRTIFHRQIVHLLNWAESEVDKKTDKGGSIVSPAFFSILNERGKQTESRSLGCTYNRRGNDRVYTDRDLISNIERTAVLLRLAQHCSDREQWTHELIDRINTADGWRVLLAGLPKAPSEVYALARFTSWISTSSVFCLQKGVVIEGLLVVLDELMSSQEIKWFELSDIRRLWDCYHLSGVGPSAAQTAQFLALVGEMADYICDEEDDRDRVDDAVYAVQKLSKLHLIDPDLVSRLQAKYDEMRSDDVSDDDSESFPSYSGSSCGGLDIDALFSTLTDR